MEKRKRAFILFLIILILLIIAIYYNDTVKLLGGLVYASIFGTFSMSGLKKDSLKSEYLKSISENKKSIKDAIDLASTIEKSQDQYLKEMVKDVKNAKEKVANLSDAELIDWGNRLLRDRRRDKTK